MTVLWGSLCNYYGDELDNVSGNTSDGKSLNHKTKITMKEEVKLAQSGDERAANKLLTDPLPFLNIEVTIPFKYLRNVWRSLVLPYFNCKVELNFL